MIFRNRSPKGIFGQNMSDLPNGPLTDGSRSLQSAVLNNRIRFTITKAICVTTGSQWYSICTSLKSSSWLVVQHTKLRQYRVLVVCKNNSFQFFCSKTNGRNVCPI